MGTVTAPVAGSGSCPAWIARVAKPDGLVVKDFSWVGQSPFAIRFSREWRIANSVFLYSAFKNLLRQIPLGRVGNQRNDALPCPEALGDFDRSVDVGASACASEHAFARGHLF